MVLLDEAAASLDPENERAVRKAIDALIQDRTVAAAAHRLKTIRRADRIYVLDLGRIVEEGRQEILLDHQGRYARLWDIQQETTGRRMASRPNRLGALGGTAGRYGDGMDN